MKIKIHTHTHTHINVHTVKEGQGVLELGNSLDIL